MGDQAARSVKDVLCSPKRKPPKSGRRSTSTTPQKKPRLQLAACPICRTRMSISSLDSHLDRCKPPRSLPSTTQATSTDPTHPLSQFSQQPPLSGSQSAKAAVPALHFIHAPPQMYTISHTDETVTTQRAYEAIVSLRSYTHPYPTSASSTLHLHAPPPTPIALHPPPSHTPAARIPPSILKSALQKCVRRNRPWPAVRIALALVRRLQSPFEVLRRLTVIILEDAVLHPDYHALVWLMASVSKSYRISDTQLHFILCIVYQVACVDRVDAQVGNIKGDESSARPEHAVCEALVVSLGIRASYGGMSHDTGLLKRAMHTWRARFADPHADWLQTITDMYNTQSMQECVPLESVRKMLRREDGVLQVGDIPLEACDFHCCRVSDEIARSITEDVLHVPRFLKLVDGAEVKAVLERLMWRYRSGVSVKKALEGDVDQAVTPSQDGSEEAVIWREELRNHIDDWCRRFRKRYGL